MKRGRKTTIWVLTSVLLSTSAGAITGGALSGPAPGIANNQKTDSASGSSDTSSSRPYAGIVDRNVFNLHPPPPPVDPNDLAKNKLQIPKLTLNGITTILGRKITFLTLPATKPGTTQETLMLAEGEAQDEVEVRQIDEKGGVVKVVNHGENQTLDFDHDGTKPPPPGANPATPVTIPPVPAAPPPNVMQSLPPPQNVMRPLRTLQGRNNPFASSSMNNNQPAMTQDQITTFIEAQRVKALQDGDPIANILPPTEMTPQVLQSQAPAPQ